MGYTKRRSVWLLAVLPGVLLLGVEAAGAQISLTSAADLALRNNLKVKLAEDDVERARFSLEEAHDVYIPTLSGSSAGLGYSYGFPLGTPTIYSVNSSSVVYNAAQGDYVRSSRDALVASNLALKEVRAQVLEDVTVTYIALDRQRRVSAALAEQLNYALHLEAIIKDRLDAGQDTPLAFTSARRTRVRIQLQQLTLDDEMQSNQDHLARLIGLAGSTVTTEPDGVPETSLAAEAMRASGSVKSYDPPGVMSSFVNARSKQEQADGDLKYAFRPIVSFGAQYSKFSTYNNAYVLYYPSVQGNYRRGNGQYVPPLTSEAVGFALNVQIPIFDRGRHAHAEMSRAEATHARHEAEQNRDNALEGRLKIEHSLHELGLRAELASLDRDYAQEQLDVILVQMQAPPVNGAPVMTPKEEQNARISERQMFIDMLDARYQLDTTEVNLLRQTGGLEDWLKSAVTRP